MQNMKDELNKRLADLEKIKKDLEDEKTRLAKEAAVLKDNLQKLSKDKDTSDSANSTSQAAKVCNNQPCNNSQIDCFWNIVA
jgi:predicted nuclease with TOPRIM domain